MENNYSAITFNPTPVNFQPAQHQSTSVNGGSGVAGVVTAGLGMLNSYFDRKQERELAEQQRDWNEQMMNKQNEFSLDMWNKTNEYNSPSKQVERLREAGLNPLYYGLDGTSANSFESAQAQGYQRASMAGLNNPVQGFIDTAVKLAQLGNIQADTAKKGQETLSEVKNREKMEVEITNGKQTLNNLRAQEGLTKSQQNQIDRGLEWLDRINEANIKATEAKAALDESTKKRIDALLEGELKIQAKTVEDFEKKWKKIEAEISKIAKENKLLDEDLINYAINHAQSGFQGTGLSVPNIIRLFGGNIGETGKNNNTHVTDGNISSSDYSQLVNDGQ